MLTVGGVVNPRRIAITSWLVLSMRRCACGARPSTSSGRVISKGKG
jgi:hypothetical protein